MTTHPAEADGDLDAQLRDYAARWHDGQPPLPALEEFDYTQASPSSGGGRRWLAMAAAVVVVAAVGATALAITRNGTHHASKPVGPIAPATAAFQVVSYDGVRVTVPAAWPVIDGAHARNTCSSTFDGQADRVFLGVSNQGVPSCPASFGNSPLEDGVWMQPAAGHAVGGTETTLPSGQTVYQSEGAATIYLSYHGVSVQVGIGPDPTVERAIVESIAFIPGAADTSVLGRCPAPPTGPPAMPTPTRVAAPLSVGDGQAHLNPEPSTIQPRVSAAKVWTSFAPGSYASGPIQWTITFGSYSALTPATINKDGSTTPEFQDVPTWLIEGVGVPTPYGPCGITVIAPYNADTGSGMGVETIG